MDLIEKKRKVLILGAGGHSKVVADVIRAAGGDVVGLCDLDPSNLGKEVEPGGGRVVVLQDELLDDVPGVLRRLGATECIVAIGHNGVRQKLSDALGEFLAKPWIDPRAILSPSATIQDGTVVLPGVIINAAARVGRAVILNTACVIEHDAVIEDGVHVSPGATLCGGVKVRQGAWVGAGSTVIPLREVGEGAVVGAAACAVREVPARVTTVGVPAKIRGEK